MASLETTRGRQVPAWQQANRYYQQPTDYIAEMQSRSQSATAPATRRRRHTNGDYTIQKGDTLSAIAKRYGTTVQAIAEANGIQDVNKIYVGDNLTIPGSNTTQSTNSSTQRQTATKQQVTRNTTVAPSTRNTSNNSDFTKEQQAAVNRYVHSLQQNTSKFNNDKNTSTQPATSRYQTNTTNPTAQRAALIPSLNAKVATPEEKAQGTLVPTLKRRRMSNTKPNQKKRNTSYVRENLQKVFDHEVIKRMKPDRPYYPNMRMQNIF